MRGRTQRVSAIGLALLAVAALPAVAQAKPSRPPCTLRGTHDYARKADVPRAALEALGLSDIAERGAPWQATDVILPGERLPIRRFVAARLEDCRLTVRYERGGIAHRWETAVAERRGLTWVALRRQ
jgi:hypothetical protein